MMNRIARVVLVAFVVAAIVSTVPATGFAQQGKKANAKAKAKPRKRKKAGGKMMISGKVIEPVAALESADLQEDFPAMCLSSKGTPLVALIAYGAKNNTDTKADTLQLAKVVGDKFVQLGDLSQPGNVYQPCLACDGEGVVWCVWSQLQDGKWNLLGRKIVDEKPAEKIVTVVKSPGNDLFPHMKTDRKGRVWVVWQRFNGGHADIFAKLYDPKKKTWSDEIQVTKAQAGDWEPRLAFSDDDDARIVFDSYRNGNFDVLLARVSPAGQTKITPIAATERYEARASAACSPDGKTLWVGYEAGPRRWGKDLGSEWRKLGGGLHYDRHMHLASVDLATGKVTDAGDIATLIPGLMAVLGTPNSNSICLPEVVVDADGNPWVFFRVGKVFWRGAVVKYDAARKAWTRPQPLAKSNYCQDRRFAVARAGKNHGDEILAVWASDQRSSKQQRTSGVYLAKIDTKATPTFVDAADIQKQKVIAPPFKPVNETPERDRADHHTWTFDGQAYTLYWGDFHRHTDFSVCRTSDDGCIKEHFRYAYDAGGLDYLATSDHTDAGKVYHEYEWWQNQRYADMFHNPPFFQTFYAYEREQRWPYGHRNIVFTKRGGPVIYIKRSNFANSRWAKDLKMPKPDGARNGELAPWQVWRMLRKSGMRAITMEHTPGGGMGTDWGVYKEIDSKIETLVEIYQGSRNSFEAAGAPQPKVARQAGPMDFGKYNAGTYQNALRLGHKLGVFASSDHRSTNISFGGVYVKKFDRDGVFDAIDVRRSIAATDKIYMQFSCNGHMLGEEFKTSKKPTMKVAVRGTAPLAAVTIIRNEADMRRFTPKGTSDFTTIFTDERPVAGENRYYVRVEQKDGNMGWTSPVWVTYKP